MTRLQTFYFIRHGQTDHNLNGILQGLLDIPLNTTGIAQAHAVRDIINGVKITKIFTSPLKRAVRTAQIINEKLKLEIEYIADLKERHWSEWEGKNKNDLPVKSHLSKLKNDELPLGAETFTDFLSRTKQALIYILGNSEVPLIIAHAGIFKALALILNQENLASDNCQLYQFKQREQKSWFIEQIT